MPTAIARLLTPEGFVIAADLRSNDRLYQTVYSESAQKIFPTSDKKLACALGGTALITIGNSDDVLFNIVPEITRALQNPMLSSDDLDGIDEYAAFLGSLLYSSYVRACRQRCIPLITKRNKITTEENNTTIFLDGYFRDQSVQREIYLCWDRPSAAALHITKTGQWFGSPKINSVLFDKNDPRLACFKLEKPKDIREAILMAQRYILSYSSAEAYSIDPETCRTVGSQSHIATITHADGFRWFPGFEPP
jgi:hypothetical protein